MFAYFLINIRPEQIGYPPRASSDPEEKSSVDEFDIQPNDLFILMTDGVLDNLFEEELVEIVNKGYKSCVENSSSNAGGGGGDVLNFMIENSDVGMTLGYSVQSNMSTSWRYL